MSRFSRHLAAASAIGLMALFGTTAANASLIVTAAVGGAPTGVSYANFDNLALGNAGGLSGGIDVSFAGDGQVVQGALSGRYAAPYLSNGNGALFGDATNGPDATHYLSTGTGSVTLMLPGLEGYIGMLWGSVDGYNSLKLYDGATLVGSLTGNDVTANANGNQGVNGTYYVNIVSDQGFDRVVASSSSYAFEFDNVAYNTAGGDVPEPMTWTIVLAGLLGLTALAAKRRQPARVKAKR